MWWSDDWMMPMMFFGPALMILFVIGCFAALFYVVRGAIGARSRGPDALEILKQRYARGEIAQAEYEERRRLLGA